MAKSVSATVVPVPLNPNFSGATAPRAASGDLTHFFIGLGDSGLLSLLALIIALVLILSRRTRSIGLVWLVSFGIISALAQIVRWQLFSAPSIAANVIQLRGPSGHAMLSALFWPFAGAILTIWSGTARARWIGIGVGVAIALYIDWLLILYEFHSWVEVCLGAVLGGGCGWISIRLTFNDFHVSAILPVVVAIVLAICIPLQHGHRLRLLDITKREVHRRLMLTNGNNPDVKNDAVAQPPLAPAGASARRSR